MPEIDEHRLIAKYFRPLARREGTFELVDDAASLAPPEGCDLVVTKDGIAEGFHFLPGETAANVARKALRVNLSDLAAKGAEPLGYLTLLGLGASWDEAWLAGFAEGLGEDQATYGIDLLGGDTIRCGQLLVSITAIGSVPTGGMVRRSGAEPGDVVYVSGTIGDAALGLLVAQGDGRLSKVGRDDAAFLEARYRVPQPRTALAAALRAHAGAALDISDGLAGDLDKLCAASGVSARVELDQVPLSDAAKAAVAAKPSLLELCATGGDDYEILCAVPEGEAASFEEASQTAGVPVTAIGCFVAGDGPAEFMTGKRATSFSRRSFSHT